jgi:cytochrome c55X
MKRAALLVLLLIPVAAASAQDEARLTRLVRHDCGSCHGLTLKGGLGPPLTPAALSGKPPAYVQAVILRGRKGSAMPPWSPFLSEMEAGWIAQRLLEGFTGAR